MNIYFLFFLKQDKYVFRGKYNGFCEKKKEKKTKNQTDYYNFRPTKFWKNYPTPRTRL